MRSLILTLVLICAATAPGADSWSLRTLVGPTSGGGYIDANGTQNRIAISDADSDAIHIATGATAVNTTIVFFTVAPGGLLYGPGPVTLSWATNAASSASIAPNVGSVPTTGSTTVTPTQTTTYTLTAAGPTGTVTAQATVWFGDRRRAVGGAKPPGDSSRRVAVRATVGGTVSLGHASMSIAPGVLRDDRDVVLTAYRQPLHQPPSGNLAAIESVLCATFAAPAAGTPPVPAAGSGSGISMTADLWNASSAQIRGAVPFAEIQVPTLPPDSRDLFLGMPGSIDTNAATATVSFNSWFLDTLGATQAGTTATLCAGALNWSASRSASAVPPPVEATAVPELLRYDGQKWIPVGVDTHFTGRTCVMVHGLLSSLESAFPVDGCVQKIKEANGCDQVLGFNYAWSQSPEKSGTELADALRGRTLGNVLIEGHSLGGVVAMNAIPKLTGVNVERLVTLGSPINGTRLTNTAEDLVTLLAYVADYGIGYGRPLSEYVQTIGLKGQLVPGGTFLRDTQNAFIGTSVNWTAVAGTSCSMPQFLCRLYFGDSQSDGVVPAESALGTAMSTLPSGRRDDLPVPLGHTSLRCEEEVINEVGAAVYHAPVLTAVLVVSPTQLAFSTTEGKDPQPDALRVSNASTATKALDYDIESSASWLKLSGPTSRIPPGGTDLYTVYAEAAGMKLTGTTPRVENASITVKERGASQERVVPATLTIKPPKYALLIGTTGTGSGTVTSSPAGIACPGKCTSMFDTDSTVTLSAQEAAGSTFNGWTGVCAGAGRTCSVMMSSDKSASAIFNSQSQPSIIAGAWSGRWTITASTQSWCVGHQGTWNADIRDNGGQLSGTWSSTDGCSGTLTGTISGSSVTWKGEGCGITFKGSVNGTTITGTFSGTESTCDNVSGEFSGTKQ